MPQASKNLILLTILLAFILSASFVFAAPAVSQGPRYFIKTANPFWQKSFGVRHAFENGFTSDLSGIQITLAKIFGIEIEPVEELHVLPEEIIVEIIKNPSAKPGAKGPIRPIPFDQTPWGVEVIYDDSVIASTSGGRGVNVAVLDTGVLKTHVDLKNRVSQCKDFTNLKTPIKDGTCDDKNGHGTHVSGIILADGGDDNLGIYGVAPEANLFVYKVCGNDGSCWADDIAIALRTAADNGANVINMSLGSDNESSFIKNAINYVVSRDVLVVAAGGNDDQNIPMIKVIFDLHGKNIIVAIIIADSRYGRHVIVDALRSKPFSTDLPADLSHVLGKMRCRCRAAAVAGEINGLVIAPRL